MSIHVPGVGEVPIIWMPASRQDYADGRFGYRPEAIVYHRAVAGLRSIDTTFAAGDSDPNTVGSPTRTVSSHFGIGQIDGRTEIHQYVNLSDTAFCNGDYHPNGKWDEWFGAETVDIGPINIWNTNPMTVSIEHDDNPNHADPTKRGIVTEDSIKTSIALTRLLLTTGLTAKREAGLHIRGDGTSAALRRIPINRRHLIDHHDIAGPNKPDCWRPWRADTIGFPRDRFIDELSTTDEEPEPAPTPDPTLYTQAQVDELITAAIVPLQLQITQIERELATEINGTNAIANEIEALAIRLRS